LCVVVVVARVGLVVAIGPVIVEIWMRVGSCDKDAGCEKAVAKIEQINFGRQVLEEYTVAMLRKRVLFLLKGWRCP
jgi:hypothetical protein